MTRPTREGDRPPLLARLRVGTKLMLLALLPVGVLIAVAAAAVIDAWRAADDLQDFRAATQESFSAGELARALSNERAATVLAQLQPGLPAEGAVGRAQRQTDVALQRAAERAASASLPVDVAGRLAAIRRQLQAPRLQAAAGATGDTAVADGYGLIVRDVLDLVRDLVSGRRPPTASVRNPADAYVAILAAIEPAERERLDVAALLTRRRDDLPAGLASRWGPLEAALLDGFRSTASGRLATELAASLFTRAGTHVTDVRSNLLASPQRIDRQTTQREWLDASRTRIADLRRIADESRGELERVVARDLDSAVARRNRVVAVSLALLVVVAAVALVLRRSITRPLAEVSGSARALSRGDLSADVDYVGRDEIGDVAEAFRDLHVTTERLAAEIRAMNAAVTRNRLDHRADVAALEGAWSQLLGGMNETMAAFGELQGRRREAELELERVFTLSLDLLCIAGLDGYLKRVNPSWERTLGYTEHELLSRPFLELVHPEDQAHTVAAVDVLAEGQEVIEFENRYVCRDGSVRWFEWTSRPVPEQGVMYAVARDVTDRKRGEAEQAALRRVATLVARGVAPARVFPAVAAEVRALLGSDVSALVRFEDDGTATVLGDIGGPHEAGARVTLDRGYVVHTVRETSRSARFDTDEPPAAEIGSLVRSLGVRSAVASPIVVEGELWGAITAASLHGPLSAAAERRLTAFTELVATAISNAESREALMASRARLLTEADAVRRRIVRDLHDGAQQRLVHTSITLGLAQRELEPHNGAAQELIAEALGYLQQANEELRELAHGILPAALTSGGLRGGINAVVKRLDLAVNVDLPPERFPREIEASAYFIVAEALTNIVKHACAESAAVSASIDDGMLRVEVRDDGIGGADPSGRGLVGLNDRATALGGQFSVDSPVGGGTVLTATLPISPVPGGAA